MSTINRVERTWDVFLACVFPSYETGWFDASCFKKMFSFPLRFVWVLFIWEKLLPPVAHRSVEAAVDFGPGDVGVIVYFYDNFSGILTCL